MADELKDLRIPIMMSPSEVKAIDDWMFSQRMKSRSAAIRELVRMGIEFEYWRSEAKAARPLIKALMKGEESDEKFKTYEEAKDRLITYYDNMAEGIVSRVQNIIEFLKGQLESSDLTAEERTSLVEHIDDLENTIKDELIYQRQKQSKSRS